MESDQETAGEQEREQPASSDQGDGATQEAPAVDESKTDDDGD